MRNKGRPRIQDKDKMKPISISISPLQLEILERISIEFDQPRSTIIRNLIDQAGFEKLGVVGGVEPHAGGIGAQQYTLKKTGLKACNPYLPRGRCKHTACQAAYEKEGL